MLGEQPGRPPWAAARGDDTSPTVGFLFSWYSPSPAARSAQGSLPRSAFLPTLSPPCLPCRVSGWLCLVLPPSHLI